MMSWLFTPLILAIDPRPQESGEIFIGGLKVKAANGVDSSRLKVKYKNKNKK